VKGKRINPKPKQRVDRRDEAKGTRVYRVYAHPLLSRSLD
jgi:hypothetical protein